MGDSPTPSRPWNWLPPRLISLLGSLTVLRLTPFDTSTEEGRAQERYRRATLSALVSYAARGLTLVTTLVSVPLTLSYLGSERYGMWMTISSVIAMLSFTDFGLGNGLLNSVAEAHGQGDRDAAARYVSSGVVMLTGIALALAALFGLIYGLVPWARVFNVGSPTAVAEAGLATAAFAACFLLNLPLSVPQQVRVAYQEGYVNSLFVGAGNLLGLGLVLLAIAEHAGLPVLVLAMAGAPLLTAAVNAGLLARTRSYLRPRLVLVSRASASALLRTGMLFFVLQIAVAVGYTSNSIVAAQVIGPGAVSEYTVATKLFLIPTTLITLALLPLWPAYREAIVRGDSSWVRQTFRRSLKLVLTLGVPSCVLLVVVGIPLIRLWVGTAVQPSFALILGIGIWTVMGGVGNAYAMLLNGAQVIRFQVATASIMATTNIALSVLLTQRIGVAGVVWGTIIAFSICSLVPTSVYVPRLIRRIQARADADTAARELEPESESPQSTPAR
jgi:O-antigen/teichoic acid export membrane protein